MDERETVEDETGTINIGNKGIQVISVRTNDVLNEVRDFLSSFGIF